MSDQATVTVKDRAGFSAQVPVKQTGCGRVMISARVENSNRDIELDPLPAVYKIHCVDVDGNVWVKRDLSAMVQVTHCATCHFRERDTRAKVGSGFIQGDGLGVKPLRDVLKAVAAGIREADREIEEGWTNPDYSISVSLSAEDCFALLTYAKGGIIARRPSPAEAEPQPVSLSDQKGTSHER